MGKERREFIRPESLNLLDYIIIDEHGRQGEYALGRTLNISEGGILMETRKPLTPGFQVLITLGLNDELVDMRGKVIRSSGKGAVYTNGIEFIFSSGDNLEILQRYIEAFNSRFNTTGEAITT
jgi:Tfp pilus assembly protein PilZ